MMTPSGAPRRPPVALIIAAILILILAVVTVVGALTVFQAPEPITEQAEDVDVLYQATLAISLVVFFGVTAGIIYAIFRYRRTDDRLPEQIHGSSTLEFTWTIIPIVILVILFVPSLILVIDLKTPKADEADVIVEAIGHQWWWEFDFPVEQLKVQSLPPDYQLQGIALGDENYQPPMIVLPVGRTVLFKVSSQDVIHSFNVPEFLFKMHAVPGTINEFSVKLTKEGVYTGQCFQFCGLRHSDMLFIIDVRSPVAYQQWLDETKEAQAPAVAGE